MDMEKLAGIIADPAALDKLQQCTSVGELVACLNKAGVACTREEGLRFLRAWESIAPDDEATGQLPDKDTHTGGLLSGLLSVFKRDGPRKSKPSQCAGSGALTIEAIMRQMDRAAVPSAMSIPALPIGRQPARHKNDPRTNARH